MSIISIPLRGQAVEVEQPEALWRGPAREKQLIHSVFASSVAFYVVVGTLAGIVGWGAIAYLTQLAYGLEVTAMRDYVSWGIYITNFVQQFPLPLKSLLARIQDHQAFDLEAV